MAELLLINPRRRRKAHAAHAKRRASVKRPRRNPVTVISSAAPHHRRKARRVHARRRHNPIYAKRRHHARRRRNPIHFGGISANGIKAMMTEAAIGGAGSTLLDIIMGYLNPMLPTLLQPTAANATTVEISDAVKAGVTIALGQGLAHATKGLSKKMAMGALTVQAAGIFRTFVPSTMTLGFYSPAAIAQGTNRIGPIRQGVNKYVQPGATQMLNKYMQPGRTQMLSGNPMQGSPQMREGVTTYR
jgi:hypothetical protein